MTPRTVTLSLCIGLALLCARASLSAQSLLFCEHKDKFYPVVMAHAHAAYVQVDGKPVAASGRRFSLKKTGEYLPCFVSVCDMEVKTSYLMINDGGEINHDFFFRARLETPYNLDNVFIVLELDTDSVGKVLFLQEVGRLVARESKLIDVGVPLAGGLGEGKYQFHLFAGGRELLHSNIPPLEREAVLDQMVAKRTAGAPDGLPAFFTGPDPEYPKGFLKAKTKGEAVIAMRIGAYGQVFDPKIKSATDPAFGESALAAVRLWRFLPRIKGGRAVESIVELPVNFSPPAKSEDKS